MEVLSKFSRPLRAALQCRVELLIRDASWLQSVTSTAKQCELQCSNCELEETAEKYEENVTRIGEQTIKLCKARGVSASENGLQTGRQPKFMVKLHGATNSTLSNSQAPSSKLTVPSSSWKAENSASSFQLWPSLLPSSSPSPVYSTSQGLRYFAKAKIADSATSCPPLLSEVRLNRHSSTYASAKDPDEATRPGQHRSPMIDKLWSIRNSIEAMTPAADFAKPPQRELIPKRPSESMLALEYPLSTDLELREKYRNPWDSLRVGRLLEDLDAIAGSVSFQHCTDNNPETRPLLLVTASVDRIKLARHIRIDADLAVTAKVTWVGRSSMEIQIRLDQPSQTQSTPASRPLLVANFTFVARDITTNKAAAINPLQPETDEEKALFSEAEARDAARKRKRQDDNLGKNEAFSKEYRERLEAFLAAGRTMLELPALADRNSMLIRDTRLENAFLCQPQQRNMHGRIFGGFLMRRAFELAFSTCYVFCGTRPAFLEMHDITFQRPVDVGDLLRFKSCVLYTEQSDLVRPLIHVEVVAYVTKPELRTSQVSNTFYFTFTVHPDDLKNHATVVRRVLPSSEEEARRYMSRFDADHS